MRNIISVKLCKLRSTTILDILLIIILHNWTTVYVRDALLSCFRAFFYRIVISLKLFLFFCRRRDIIIIFQLLLLLPRVVCESLFQMHSRTWPRLRLTRAREQVTPFTTTEQKDQTNLTLKQPFRTRKCQRPQLLPQARGSRLA